mgnify:CR=1 FL=1
MDRITVNFRSDLPSYGLIGFVGIGLILYFTYICIFIRNRPSSTVYIYFSQLILILCLLSSLTNLFHSTILICSIQTLTFQILPFCFLLGLNIHFLCQWLIQLTKLSAKSCFILFSTFFLFFILILIQTAILLIWFYYQNQNDTFSKYQCQRSYFLYSLILNFILLIIYFIQTTIRFYFNKQIQNLIYFLTSLFALIVTISWICLFIYLPTDDYLLGYGILIFVYVFLGPFLYGQIFYKKTYRNQVCHSNK